jgi:two-component system repressor protein LuxO
VNRILVVEDEADLAVTYDRLLRREGYRVVRAGSCVEALHALTSAPPALVIADLRLPDGDGLDIIRAAHARTPRIPVIVVTAFVSRAARDSARASGASAFLAKPFITAVLLRLVHDEIERSIPEPGRIKPPCHQIL